MKRILPFLLGVCLTCSLFSFEVYETNVYPGAVNHLHTSFGYGIFHLNTMESQFRSVTVSRSLNFNKSLTLYEYSYNSEGQLEEFKESFRINNGEITESGIYSYEYKENKLASVKHNGQDIYFLSPYFLIIRSGGNEQLFDFEHNSAGEVISILYNDENGTKYFFRDGLLKSIESIGTGDDRLSAEYDYFDNGEIKRYRMDYSEGRGASRKKTAYDFSYSSDGIIEKFFLEKSGDGQNFNRVNCIFENILNDDGTINTIFAQDDKGETVRTARFEYVNRNNYTVEIFDDRNQLMVTYGVEQN